MNIEIVGASHFDYMRRDDAFSSLIDNFNPERKAWNERVSEFVTNVIINADSKLSLDEFLTDALTQGIAVKEGNRWIIRLEGWQERDPGYGQ